MHLAGGDADFRAHAEFTAIGELGRGVAHQDGAVEALEEARRLDAAVPGMGDFQARVRLAQAPQTR